MMIGRILGKIEATIVDKLCSSIFVFFSILLLSVYLLNRDMFM